jgi:asparaginyl-tRNA synthetase
MEFLREIAHLRVRSNTFGAVFRVRNALSFAVHKFFQERGFLYLNTPIITASDAEGAGAMFRVTTLDLMNLPRPVNNADDFFYRPPFWPSAASSKRKSSHSLSPMSTASGRLPRGKFQYPAIWPNSDDRAGEAFCDLDGNRKLAEDFLKYIIAYVLDHRQADSNLNKRIDKWCSQP